MAAIIVCGKKSDALHCVRNPKHAGPHKYRDLVAANTDTTGRFDKLFPFAILDGPHIRIIRAELPPARLRRRRRR